ncbi:MAG: FkbM family methyltransferase, partial [Planctomycetes bacterium]|nr:FkbM family methyltransferase [Planctomycetota bacterium]
MSDYYQRLDFYLRRYHDGPLQMLLWRVLRPGDTFVDGGANTGLVSMFAAWQVGPRGRVLAFEPNPTPRAQLEWHVRKNGLGQVRVLPVDCVNSHSAIARNRQMVSINGALAVDLTGQ